MSNPNTFTAPQQSDAELQAGREHAYEAYFNLQEEGLPLDGPNLTKAGLGYEERMKLGYVGSMDKFIEDAQSWHDTKQEEARVAEVRAEANAKADAWHEETKAWREQRQAADQRVADLMDGTSAVKGMSYKEKLEAGGEIGVRQKVEQAKMSEADALSEAEAEGVDVGHRKPRYVEVATNQAAEDRAKEMAELLKAQLPQAKDEVPQDDSFDFDWETGESLDPTPEDDAELGKILEQAEAENPEAAGETVRLTIKQRLLRRLKQAAGHVYMAPQYAQNAVSMAREYLADEEKGRRRRVVAGVVGVAAVGSYLMAQRYGGDLFSPAAEATTPSGSGNGPNQELVDALSGRGGGTQQGPSQELVDALTGNGAGDGGVVPQFDTVKLQSGDTIWDLEAARHPRMSEAEIHELVRQDLEANDLSWDDAEHLQVGDTIKLSRKK